MHFNKLTPEEKQVILNKGTEMSFTGQYYNYQEDGTYLCKQCNATLYKSSDKFDSHCGWPSFDDEIEGAVTRTTDADGHRTEITCTNCGAHLGHVFEGEGYTDKNTRHCVNSISLNFMPVEIQTQQKLERAIYAAGCFWGVEYYMQKENGVVSTTVGYIGGTTKNPTYQEVCSHKTGHVEAVEVYFNPDIISYEKLTKIFFELHDPTQVDRQGPDVGEQYRSEIFYMNDYQKQIAEDLIQQLEAKGFKVATKLTPATEFYPAEDYHQDYYDHKGSLPYCHFRTQRF
ncbi:MAG: bifunctional methionine sulfoxide reductase B/A protein [Bacteroidales bacterium]|nr:bifunctional methionine sulfoxide reductase B/A protein [Bacteroidales bacterium]